MASRDIHDLLPEVASMAKSMLATCQEQGLDVVVSCTYRSNEEQAALYDQGRTTAGHIVTWAKAGQSLHNHRRALDVYPLVNGKLAGDKTKEDLALWVRLGAIGEAAGFTWGGRWLKIDRPHFERAENAG